MILTTRGSPELPKLALPVITGSLEEGGRRNFDTEQSNVTIEMRCNAAGFNDADKGHKECSSRNLQKARKVILELCVNTLI